MKDDLKFDPQLGSIHCTNDVAKIIVSPFAPMKCALAVEGTTSGNSQVLSPEGEPEGPRSASAPFVVVA